MPTQAVSNEEFIPRPQSEPQKQVEQLIGEMSEARAKKLGIDRRAFMASTMGLATCFLAQNKIFCQQGLGRGRNRNLGVSANGGEIPEERILHHRLPIAFHQWPGDWGLSQRRVREEHGLSTQD